jgi:alpha-L-rhamnosidase
LKTSSADLISPVSFRELAYSEEPSSVAAPCSLKITATFCESLVSPLGVDVSHPLLSWHSEAIRNGAKAIACQVQVATSQAALLSGSADLWDSRRREIGTSPGLTYEGQPFTSSQTAWWRCRVWDDQDTASDWSAIDSFEAGLLDESSWHGAKWIQPSIKNSASPYLRREFSARPGLRQARAYFCGLGFGELWINGSKASDGLLNPAQTDYERYALYQVFDVTSLLESGGNCVGAILGDGWYHQDRVWTYQPYGTPGMRLALLLEYHDASTEWIVSDEDWLTSSDGPIRSSNLYAGEIYDATKEFPGWNLPGFSPEGWTPASLAAAPLSPALRAQLMPPERVTQILPALAKHRTRPGTWVFDFGQNFAGHVKLTVTGEAGHEYCLRFAENIDISGDIDPLSTGTLFTKYVPTDRYFCRGEGVEEWEPRFTFHGFRYVEVTGFSDMPADDALIGMAVHTAAPPIGLFACSDPLINQLQSMALWTLRSNLHALPTDCPAREKCGWLGDSHHISAVASYNLELGPLWRKYFTDILNSCGQAKIKVDNSPPDPRMPSNIAPGLRRCEQAHPDWAAAMVLIPWHLFLFEGDRETFTRGYPAMMGMMSYLAEMAPDGIVREGFGDWCPPARKDFPSDCPVALTSTAFYYQIILCMERFARELQRPEDEEHFRSLGLKVRHALNASFLDLGEATYGSQTGNVIALALGLVPEAYETKVARSLAVDLGEKSKGHFTMGIHGMHYIFHVLSAYGHDDVCRQVLDTTGFPSFRHLISQDATTFWEMFFDLNLHPDLAERSRNHPMHAAFAGWFYQGIGGISPDPASPGFAKVLLQPRMTDHLEWANTSFVSVRGPIKSDWRSDHNHFSWQVTIPGGSVGQLTFPPRVKASEVRENGELVSNLPEMKKRSAADGSLVLELGAGSYTFKAPYRSS